MTDQNINELWGELRSLTSKSLSDTLLSDYAYHVSPDAGYALEAADFLQKFPQQEQEAAGLYAQKALQRVGVDSELFRTAVRFAAYNPVKRPMLGRFFASAREGYLGQVYTSDYQGNVEAYYLDDGVLYKTQSSYGSCSYCCSFQQAQETSRSAQVLESFRLRGMCKVVHAHPHPDDVKHLVEMAHETFVRRYGEYQTVGSYYTDPSWGFKNEPDESPEEDLGDDYDDSWDHY